MIAHLMFTILDAISLFPQHYFFTKVMFAKQCERQKRNSKLENNDWTTNDGQKNFIFPFLQN